MKQFITSILAGAALVSSGSVAYAAESSDPIKLAMNEWTGQHITTKVAGAILERMGYTVEYVTAGYYPQLTAMQDGTISATLEIWSSNIGEGYQKALDSGQVEVLGDLGLKPRETWMYNDTLAASCPGLPDWNALKGCAEQLITAETFPQGRLLDYPAEWGTTNVDRIAALGLNLKSIPAGSEGALISEIKAADAANKPLLVMFWAPHWVHALHSLSRTDLPAFDDACYTDASWGINPNATYDCNWDQSAHIDKMGWVGMQEKWPGAYKFLQAYQLTNAQQEPMMKAVDVDGQDIEAVVAAWVDANEATWKPWTE